MTDKPSLHVLFASLETGRRSASGELNSEDPGAEFARFFAKQPGNGSSRTTWVQPGSKT